MATPVTVAVDLGPRRMLVGGQWVDAASGATLATEDPSTGRTIATVRDIEPVIRPGRP